MSRWWHSELLTLAVNPVQFKGSPATVTIWELARLDPNNSVFRNSLGIACYRLGRYEDARQHLQQADALHLSRGRR